MKDGEKERWYGEWRFIETDEERKEAEKYLKSWKEKMIVKLPKTLKLMKEEWEELNFHENLKGERIDKKTIAIKFLMRGKASWKQLEIPGMLI